ncbi:MAG: cation:proton antiporter [Caulobacterales bacterium 32-69-10]|nr:MAG: cation:proton antiporter [Caulobacterales bacterium 32-69-10]
MVLALIVLTPFLGAWLPVLMNRAGPRASAAVAGIVTLVAFACLLGLAPVIMAGGTVRAQIDWVPSLGLQAGVFLDPLGLLFAGLILGIGLLVIAYADAYLARSDSRGKFYAFLLLFQGAMLGIVLSDNVLLLLVFWELTSLTSFLLIGFWREKAESRQGARLALAVTGGGGLALMGGLLLLGDIVGSYDLGVILHSRDAIQASPQYLPALILILIGCFAKSAQFPFHFWLPHAMAAPTPVSAYLHSATMVKAGIFLMARLWPVLSGTEAWFYIVTATGLITMLLGALVALFKTDLKSLLAYSTISQLGLLTMLLGFGTPTAAVVAVFHIINHAIFKAALFMNAGIVDHEAGSRDIARLGGLAPLMPITALVAAVAAGAMAGLPPLNGFISKEMMLEEALHTPFAGQAWLLPALAGLGALLSAAYSIRYVWRVYFSAAPAAYPKAPHDPSVSLWGPSGLLAALAVLIGLFPAALAGPLVLSAAGAVIGEKAVFDLALGALIRRGGALSRGVHNGSLQRYLAWFIGTAVVVGFAGLAIGGYEPGGRPGLPAPPVAILTLIMMAAGAALVLVRHHARFEALIYTSIIGLILAAAFVYLSAPDLALTQITVEVVTILLLLLALNLLPKATPTEGDAGRHLRDIMLAGAGGLGLGAAAWAVLTRPGESISAYYWANAYTGGGGTNVVNVILVDFRGFDTFGEIIVLGVAALGIFALLEPADRGESGRRLAAWLPDHHRSPERHAMMMVVATRLLLPLALTVGVYMFLRGHNQPGGGFIAGLVISIALIMQYLASGYAWADRRMRFDHHVLIGAGVLVATGVGVAAMALGAPFLTSAFDYFNAPLIGEFELATAMAFDLGVASAVIGAVMLALAQLSHVAQRAERLQETDAAMDVDPTRAREAGHDA